MFDPFEHEDTALNEEIARVYSHLSNFSAEDDEYQKAARQLTALYALKNQTAQLNLQAQKDFAAHQLESDKNAWQEEQDSRPFYMRVEPGTVVTVAGNLVIALIVIKYEQRSVISTKVMSFMKKI
jgi:Na+-translocating ferredoxin:NAD+ oxidoreductase RnfG subunit